MAVSKVIYGDQTLVDLTGDTVTADKLLSGYTAHDASGSQITGTADLGPITTIDNVVQTEDLNLKSQISSPLYFTSTGEIVLCASVYNNKIHFFLKNHKNEPNISSHWSFDGTEIIQEPNIPEADTILDTYNYYVKSCVFNDYLYIYVTSYVSSTTYVKLFKYSYLTQTWQDLSSALSNLPETASSTQIFSCPDGIHILGFINTKDRVKHYKLDESNNTFIQLSNIPISNKSYSMLAITTNDGITHFSFKSSNYNFDIYQYNYITDAWTQITSSSIVTLADPSLSQVTTIGNGTSCIFYGMHEYIYYNTSTNTYAKQFLNRIAANGVIIEYNQRLYYLGYNSPIFQAITNTPIPVTTNIPTPNIPISQESYIIDDQASISGNASRGVNVPIADVSDIVIIPYDSKITLKWDDPSDDEIRGTKVTEWAGTKIVRKIGSVPASVNDGTLVVDSKIRDAHVSTVLEDTGLVNDTEYYYRFFPYKTNGLITLGSSVSGIPNGISNCAISLSPGGYSMGAIYFKNHIYRVGGYSSSSNVLFQRLDGNSWTTLANLPYTFDFTKGGAIFEYNNSLYIFGFIFTDALNYCYRWNGNTFTQLSNMPGKIPSGANDTSTIPRIFHDKLYMVLENSGNRGLYCYNFTTLTWSDSLTRKLINVSNVMSYIQYDENNLIILCDNVSGTAGLYLLNLIDFNTTLLSSDANMGQLVFSNNNLYRMKTNNYDVDIFDFTNNVWNNISSKLYNSTMRPTLFDVDGTLHMMGGYRNGYLTSHYRFNGTEWVTDDE